MQHSTSVSSSSADQTPNKKHKRQHDHDELENCPICIEVADPVVSEVCILACGHVFHSVCLQCALINKNACPICRSEITACQHDVHGTATLLEENRMLRATLLDYKNQTQEFEDYIIAQRIHAQQAHGYHTGQLHMPIQSGRGDMEEPFQMLSNSNGFVNSAIPEERKEGGPDDVPVDAVLADMDVYMHGIQRRIRMARILGHYMESGDRVSSM